VKGGETRDCDLLQTRTLRYPAITLSHLARLFHSTVQIPARGRLQSANREQSMVRRRRIILVGKYIEVHVFRPAAAGPATSFRISRRYELAVAIQRTCRSA